MSDYPVYESILARRSVRTYLARPVEREKIGRMLRAAMAAPSACNLQPWAFIVVDDQDQLSRIKAVTGQGDYNAPLLIAVCGIDGHIPWEGDDWKLDCGAAAENLMLEATELGLGSVCIGGFDEEALRDLLQLPGGVYPLCLIELGYPVSVKPPHTWYTEDAVYWQAYDPDRPRTMRTIEMLREDAAAGRI